MEKKSPGMVGGGRGMTELNLLLKFSIFQLNAYREIHQSAKSLSWTCSHWLTTRSIPCSHRTKTPQPRKYSRSTLTFCTYTGSPGDFYRDNYLGRCLRKSQIYRTELPRLLLLPVLVNEKERSMVKPLRLPLYCPLLQQGQTSLSSVKVSL